MIEEFKLEIRLFLQMILGHIILWRGEDDVVGSVVGTIILLAAAVTFVQWLGALFGPSWKAWKEKREEAAATYCTRWCLVDGAGTRCSEWAYADPAKDGKIEFHFGDVYAYNTRGPGPYKIVKHENDQTGYAGEINEWPVADYPVMPTNLQKGQKVTITISLF